MDNFIGFVIAFIVTFLLAIWSRNLFEKIYDMKADIEQIKKDIAKIKGGSRQDEHD